MGSLKYFLVLLLPPLHPFPLTHTPDSPAQALGSTWCKILFKSKAFIWQMRTLTSSRILWFVQGHTQLVGTELLHPCQCSFYLVPLSSFLIFLEMSQYKQAVLIFFFIFWVYLFMLYILDFKKTLLSISISIHDIFILLLQYYFAELHTKQSRWILKCCDDGGGKRDPDSFPVREKGNTR